MSCFGFLTWGLIEKFNQLDYFLNMEDGIALLIVILGRNLDFSVVIEYQRSDLVTEMTR